MGGAQLAKYDLWRKRASEWIRTWPAKSGYGNIDPDTTKNVKWVARLGSQSYGSPVVAAGKVFVGTNNEAPRDARIEGDRGVMMCFEETTGEFLWQLVVPKLDEIKWSDWHYVGITSPPTVEYERAYLVSNRCEVICLDTKGMADGNDGPYTDEGRHMVNAGEKPLVPGNKDADVIWLYDMVAQAGVYPHNASNSSILIHGDGLYVCTGNGCEWTHEKVPKPNAPTIVVLDKKTGKPLARDDFGVGADIIHGQWSSPSLGRVGGKPRMFMGTGNGYVYAFEPWGGGGHIGNRNADKLALLKNVWKFNGHPLAQSQDDVRIEHGYNCGSYEVFSMPVFYKNRVYVTVSQDPWYKKKLGWLVCVDAAGNAEVTRTGLLWSYKNTGASLSTVSIADGLLYVADYAGQLHCLDADTGECYWVHEAGGPIWSSTLVADRKVYLGTGRQVFWVLAHGRKLEVINRIRMRDRIFTTPTVANGVLYVATNKHLYAVGKP